MVREGKNEEEEENEGRKIEGQDNEPFSEGVDCSACFGIGESARWCRGRLAVLRHYRECRLVPNEVTKT